MTTLFETLRVEHGRPVRAAGHLRRMARSAAELGIPFDLSAARRAVHGGPPGTWRLRVTLAPDGRLSAERWRFETDPPGTTVKIGWAEERIHSSDPARRHKSSDREVYERGTRTAQEAGLADLVFLNERDELVEGAISTLLVRIGGAVLTPPVSSGALPGVLREAWLARGLVREATLRPDDLRRAERVWIANSLRGLRPARLVGERTGKPNSEGEKEVES